MIFPLSKCQGTCQTAMMSSIFRLGSRKFLDQVLRHEKMGMLSLVRPITIKAQPAKSESLVGHDERNMKLGRPQSPHLTIYAPQLTSMLSISHRITGMMLAGYTVLFSAAAIWLPDTIPHYLEALECKDVGVFLLTSAKFTLAFPLTYHFWNGIRHLVWDMGKMFTLKEVYASGYVMLALAFGSALVLSVM